ncbi:hypothetical protein [Streptomyces sp. MK37H]|uniref:hypothetical protein n=1 Tax=Streptomyces sp. MK37H TaxID=2699117 RepID=UPI001B35A9FB|nr:hypothetical protein [Streptomyces sp. MK37H]MBP8535858.1 hypothetical protein [Streptomyces sp. MK37H]
MDEKENAAAGEPPEGARRQGRLGILLVSLGAALAIAMVAGGLGFAFGSDDSPKSSGSAGAGDKKAKSMAFVECLRDNGVPDFPDPAADGSILLDPSSGIDVKGDAYKKAEKACERLMPEGRRASPPPGGMPDLTKYVDCMRKNGVPEFPDPKGGGFAPEEAGIDVKSPEFRDAHKACRQHLPAGAPGPA